MREERSKTDMLKWKSSFIGRKSWSSQNQERRQTFECMIIANLDQSRAIRLTLTELRSRPIEREASDNL